MSQSWHFCVGNAPHSLAAARIRGFQVLAMLSLCLMLAAQINSSLPDSAEAIVVQADTSFKGAICFRECMIIQCKCFLNSSAAFNPFVEAAGRGRRTYITPIKLELSSTEGSACKCIPRRTATLQTLSATRWLRLLYTQLMNKFYSWKQDLNFR